MLVFKGPCTALYSLFWARRSQSLLNVTGRNPKILQMRGRSWERARHPAVATCRSRSGLPQDKQGRTYNPTNKSVAFNCFMCLLVFIWFVDRFLPFNSCPKNKVPQTKKNIQNMSQTPLQISRNTNFVFREVVLATGREPGTFSEQSYRISYKQIWILKDGVQRPGSWGSPYTPPPL